MNRDSNRKGILYDFKRAFLVPFLCLCAGLMFTACSRENDHADHGHDHHAPESAHTHNTGDAHDHSNEAARAHPDDGHGHDHAHGPTHRGEATAGASFSEGKGLLLKVEAARQIDLQTAIVARQDLAVQIRTTARVYETAHAHSPDEGRQSNHDSHATAILSAHLAGYLAPGQPVAIERPSGSDVQGRLRRLDAGTAQAIGQVEAIIDVPDPEHEYDFGNFVKVTFQGEEREVVAVPKSALLAAATGKFVYTKRGDYFRRTPVQTGAESDGLVEITEGLVEGDVVVTRGAEDLWLIELRFTKGGGHSH